MNEELTSDSGALKLDSNSLDSTSQGNLKAYIFFWIGQLVSLFGSNIAQFVIVWWITIYTESAIYLGLSAALGFGTQIFLTPVAGVLVDRWSRRKLIATVDFLQAVVTLGLIYLFIQHTNVAIWHVLLVLSLRGAFQSFHQPAVQAIIPLLIPRDKLSRMNGLDYLMGGVIFLIGPIVAALLLAIWEIYQILWVDVITFLIAVIPLAFITIPSVRREPPEDKEKTSFRTEFTEGISFIKRTPGLLTLLVVFMAANFFLPAVVILLPLWVTMVHNGGAEQLAVLMALQQAGMIPGAGLMSVWKGFNRKVVGVVIGILFGYVAILVIALAPLGAFWFMGIGMVLEGLLIPIANVSSQTIWQSIVPPELQGRVFSVRVTIAQATAPIAAIVSGILADVFGIKSLFLAFAVLGLVFVAYSWLFTELPTIEKAMEQHGSVLYASTGKDASSQ